MTRAAWQPYGTLEAELKKLEALLSDPTDEWTPEQVELHFNRAATLAELGRVDEARQAYLALIPHAPTHFGALNNLGILLMATGYSAAARTAYAEAVKHHPDNPGGHINLANALAKVSEVEPAIAHFEAALRLDPEHYEAHQGLSHLLTDIGEVERARIHREKGFRDRPILLLPYRGKTKPVALLLLASAAGGTVPIRHHLDDTVFFTSVLFVDFYDPILPFPPHQLVFNAVGDADVCAASLAAAEQVLQRTHAPVINLPAKVKATGRAENARRLAGIPGVITPKMAMLPRAQLIEAALAEQGFTYPFLLRAPGFHTGRFFSRIDNAQTLAAVAPSMPGQELIAMQYLDARSADGNIRKYRVMMIGGELYPLHVAISREWKIHYFSAEMADNPENRAEDKAFLNDMPDVLGPRAMQALGAIRDMLGLDYAGADFSLNAQGDLLLFEANATMVVNPPDADARWDYRRPAIQRILDAIRQLLTSRAAATL